MPVWARMAAVPEAVSFPRLSARTQRFRLGVPREFVVAADGRRVLFLRSSSGSDPVHALWSLDLDSGQERQLADPRRLLSESGEQLSAQERARRERMRESGAGIVAFSTDRAADVATFALSGRLYTVDTVDTVPRRLATPTGVIDPRLDPTGRRVAYVAAGALRVVGLDGDDGDDIDRALVAPDGPQVTWGLAEFIASEELERTRGHWWSPDGERLLVERVDDSAVGTWWVADPANPDREPVPQRYPAAGTANADVSLWLVELDGTRREVTWDHAAYEYLVSVHWSAGGAPLLRVLSRDQTRGQVLAVDVASGATAVLAADADPAWLDVVPGVPARLPDGRVLDTVEDEDTRRLTLDGAPVTPPGVQVLEVVAVSGAGVLLATATEPTRREVRLLRPDGELAVVADGAAVHVGAGSPEVTVLVTRGLDLRQPQVRVVRAGKPDVPVAVVAEPAPALPAVTLLEAGPHDVRTAVVLPTGHVPGSRRLPVLLSPYGGPHGPKVLASAHAFLEAQWLADQGFAVVVADGRGTSARGPAWDRAVAGDLVTPVLEDQVSALHAAAGAHPDLDLDRVGIRGWSFGGWLAALAVLHRPDTFHAAVAGAPVTDWALYDTAYSERYLGRPGAAAERYARHSLVGVADRLTRPLLLVHGLADDNVVVAHTLRLSGALLAAGRAHQVLPLSGITHLAAQEEVAENLLLLEVDFLHHALR